MCKKNTPTEKINKTDISRLKKNTAPSSLSKTLIEMAQTTKVSSTQQTMEWKVSKATINPPTTMTRNLMKQVRPRTFDFASKKTKDMLLSYNVQFHRTPDIEEEAVKALASCRYNGVNGTYKGDMEKELRALLHFAVFFPKEIQPYSCDLARPVELMRMNEQKSTCSIVARPKSIVSFNSESPTRAAA